MICKSFSFNTAHGRIKGSRDAATDFIDNDADAIFVKGNAVKLYVSGVDLSGLRSPLRPFYSEIGRPSIDPELMIRILIVGYCFGIRSERRLCEAVHLNIANPRFCRLGPEGDVPDHSTLSKNRHGRSEIVIFCASCSRRR